MKLYIVLLVAVFIADKASCGVIEGAYDKVSNTTQAVKEDVYSWWSYGVDKVMGESEDASKAAHPADEDQSSLIGKFYNKVKGGVSSGYMKVHNFILGEDSDPNKTIIRTLYERALKRLSDIKSYIFGDHHPADKPESHKIEESVKEEVLKLLFSNNTHIFDTESEKSALESLRSKLTKTGDEVLSLANDEKDVIRKAYESVRHKSDELMSNADNMKTKMSENIDKTQEFIRDESKKFNEAAQNVGEEVKKAGNDIEKRLQSE
ncbi:uncharacterized protein LOC134665434 [Cydia fagiglandana]|uniref:uncharacterized protein LOC134665434 n=1 Tax=Cydia fagiglandana TaxID=1458189 RepID=UPI002FEE4E38